MDTPTATFKWNDKFWDTAYNEMAAKFSANAPKTNVKKVVKDDDSFDEMIEIDDSDDVDTSFSSFEGELVI